jgi:CheY-like chemotaxis protein
MSETPAPRQAIGEEYLAQAVHELRGSLNAILGWAEFLRSQACDSAARARAAEAIVRHARQQSAMIGELVDTWRLTAGTLTFSVESVDLSRVIETAIETARPAARLRSVRIDATPEPGLRVRADGRRLAQALTTVVSNSVHFAPEGSVLTVQVDASPGMARLRIHDEGPSPSEGALAGLFDRNRPLEALRASPRSAFRLGLAFVRDVVVHLGGSIDAESAGGGFTYRILLPTEPDAHPRTTDRVSTSEAPSRVRPPRITGLRVLLVDDEADAREALMGILEHYGATVRSASSASEALVALKGDRFDVLLADIGMPGADGYDLIQEVRRLDSAPVAHIPAMAVTAFASDADRRHVLDAGFQMHLAKPVDPVALVAAVATLGRSEVSIR